jgi:D-alanyl-D-alanine carboxypeptidase (penicillin-binding protein 5/6)
MLRIRLATLSILACCAVQAQEVTVPNPPELPFKSYYLADFSTDTVLAESNADERLPPASLTKLMTAYVVFAALKDGRLHLDDEVPISKKAWRTPGTRTFVEVGTQVKAEDLIRGMLIQSGNDASVALAEDIAGSVPKFVEAMNQRAQMLGMTDSVFRNPTGLPAAGHVSTARDLATLARALIRDFPEYYAVYREREFTYNGIRQHNRNALLWRDPSVDGMKTGHTVAAGYCLVTSAERDGMRLIAVIMGADSARARTVGAEKLLDYGFRAYETHTLYSAGQQISVARVLGGDPNVTPLGLAHDLVVTIPRGYYPSLSASMNLSAQLVAPLEQGTPVGEVEVLLDGNPLSNSPLIALKQVAEGGLWTKLVDKVDLWLE